MSEGVPQTDLKPAQKFSRRDALKLGGAVIAGAVLSKYVDLSPDPIQIQEEVVKNDGLVNFRLDKEITQAEIESCKKMFDKIAVGVEELKKDSGSLTQDEITSIDSFDKQVFIESTSGYVDKLVRLQKVHKKFDNDVDLDRNVRSEALNLVKYNFKKLAIPLNVFNKVNYENLDISSKDLAKKVFLDINALDKDIPVDPVIGMEIYGEIGMQTWFNDFDYKIVDGVTIGTYPVTKKFFRDSGRLFRELSDHSGSTHELGNHPDHRQRIFGFNSELETLSGYEIIETDPEVKELIYSELEKYGVDRSFYGLAVRYNKDQTDIWAFHSSETPEEINLTITSNKLDREYFEANKDIILYGIKHEIFHVLETRTKKMNDYDSYYVQAKLTTMFKESCPTYKGKYIRERHDISFTGKESMTEYFETAFKNFNESYRNMYIDMLVYVDSLNLKTEIFDLYNLYLYKDTEFWKSDLLKVDFQKDKYDELDYNKKLNLADKSVKWTVNHIKDVYEKQKDSMTYLEKFISEEIIELSKDGNMISDICFYFNGASTNEYIKNYLQGMVMYKSIMRKDNKFLNAIAKDLKSRVVAGDISEDRERYVLRKVGNLVNLKHEEQGGFVSTNSEEFLADQFAYSLISNLGFDFANPLSSVKSFNEIKKLKPQFRELLDFYKQRNLANVDSNLV